MFNSFFTAQEVEVSVAGNRELEQLNLPTGRGNGPTNDPDSFGDGPHDAVGAYVLDALTDEERATFEAHLSTCASCQQEVAELASVVGVLPGVIEFEDDAGTNRIPALSSGLRDRMLAAALADDATGSGVPPVVELKDAPIDEPIPFPPPRPEPRPRTMNGHQGTPTPIDVASRLHRSWLVAAVLAVLLAGSGVWGLVQRGHIDDKNQNIAQLQRELDEAQTRANASAWHLNASAGGETHSGTLLYSLQDKTVVLVVRDMPELPSDKVYQAWLIRGSNPEPASTFTVNADGTGMALVDPNAPTYDGVAITEEPSGGSQTPTSPILLQGQLSGAVGMLPGVSIASVPLTPPDGDDAS